MENALLKKMTIENASEISTALREYIKSDESPVIDLSAVEKIDLSGIQLLISAQKYGPKHNKSIYFTGNLSENIQGRLIDSGFRIVPSSASADLYTIRRNSSEV